MSNATIHEHVGTEVRAFKPLLNDQIPLGTLGIILSVNEDRQRMEILWGEEGELGTHYHAYRNAALPEGIRFER